MWRHLRRRDCAPPLYNIRIAEQSVLATLDGDRLVYGSKGVVVKDGGLIDSARTRTCKFQKARQLIPNRGVISQLVLLVVCCCCCGGVQYEFHLFSSYLPLESESDS